MQMQSFWRWDMAKEVTDISDDLIFGIKDIANFLGQPQRRIYHLVNQGHLPGVFKIAPRRHAALRSVLLENLRNKAKGAEPKGVSQWPEKRKTRRGNPAGLISNFVISGQLFTDPK
jgi:predicted DNA-binding transcriptional regulator AlpA